MNKIKKIAILSLLVTVVIESNLFPFYLAPFGTTEIDILTTQNNGNISFLFEVFIPLNQKTFVVPHILIIAFKEAFQASEIFSEDIKLSSEQTEKERYDLIIAFLQEKTRQDPDGEAAKLFHFFLTGDKRLTNVRRKAFEKFLRSLNGFILIPKENLLETYVHAIDSLTMAAWHTTMEEMSGSMISFLTAAKHFFKIQFPQVYETISLHIKKKYPYMDPEKHRTFWFPFVFPFRFNFQDFELLNRAFNAMRNRTIPLIPVGPFLRTDKDGQLREFILPIKDKPGTIVSLELLYNGISTEDAILDRCIKNFNELEKKFFELFGEELAKNGKLKLYKRSFMRVRREMDENIERFGFRKSSPDKPYYSMPEAERYKISQELQEIPDKSV